MAEEERQAKTRVSATGRISSTLTRKPSDKLKGRPLPPSTRSGLQYALRGFQTADKKDASPEPLVPSMREAGDTGKLVAHMDNFVKTLKIVPYSRFSFICCVLLNRFF